MDGVIGRMGDEFWPERLPFNAGFPLGLLLVAAELLLFAPAPLPPDDFMWLLFDLFALEDAFDVLEVLLLLLVLDELLVLLLA